MDIDPELIPELERLAATDRIRALVILREHLKIPLREAVDRLEKLFPLKVEWDGYGAEVYAIGPYSPELLDFMDYPADCYQSLEPGLTVIVSLVSAVGWEDVNRLAAAFGIDAADFNQHSLKAECVEVARLAQDEIAGLAALAFERFHAAGFSFHFFLCPPESATGTK